MLKPPVLPVQNAASDYDLQQARPAESSARSCDQALCHAPDTPPPSRLRRSLSGFRNGRVLCPPEASCYVAQTVSLRSFQFAQSASCQLAELLLVMRVPKSSQTDS